MPPLQRVPRKMLAGLELHHLPSTASRLWKFFDKLRLYARQSVRLSLDQAYSVRHSALSNCANALRSTSKTREMSQPRMDMFTASPHSNARFRASRTPVVSKANFLRGTATTVLHRNYPVCSNSCPSTPNLIRKQICQPGTSVHRIHVNCISHVTLCHWLTHLGCVYNRSL
jgi:hypothetical protein